ncbi:MAG: glycosyltransferase family 2 protein [Thermosynechococcaceae cyanobacterium MS004]|nr:glycosyltransferase family 2 protein [Thermosynechococcaceae cyanobacterium MS004]
MKLQFSVVIPTYHRNDLLAKCLDCLAPGVQTISPEFYEVIVTDDGSESTAEEMIKEKYSWVKWVAGPRQGPAANRNNGAKVAQGEWLVFTDDDCLPEADWLFAYSKAINQFSLALEGSIHPIGNPNQDLAECPVNLEGGCFWSANVAIKSSLFFDLEGFDPNYVLAAQEDQDLKLRIESVTNITFVSDAKVYHPVRYKTLYKSIKQIPSQVKNWCYYVKKNSLIYQNGGLYVFMLRLYKLFSCKMVNQALNVQPGNSLISFLYLVYGLPLACSILATRTNYNYIDKGDTP